MQWAWAPGAHLHLTVAWPTDQHTRQQGWTMSYSAHRLGTGAVGSDDHYRRADDDDENQCDDKSAERGEGRLAATPTPRLAGGANGPGVDRFVLEEASQFVGKFFRGRVAARKFLFQAL